MFVPLAPFVQIFPHSPRRNFYALRPVIMEFTVRKIVQRSPVSRSRTQQFRRCAPQHDYALQRTAALERFLPNFCHTGRDGNLCQAVAVDERRSPDACHAGREGNLFQAGAAAKRRITDACHTGREGNLYQTDAVAKRTIPDACHARREGNLRHISVIKKHIPDVCHLIRYLCADHPVSIVTETYMRLPARQPFLRTDRQLPVSVKLPVRAAGNQIERPVHCYFDRFTADADLHRGGYASFRIPCGTYILKFSKRHLHSHVRGVHARFFQRGLDRLLHVIFQVVRFVVIC